MPYHPALEEQLGDPYGFWTPWKVPADVKRLKAYRAAMIEGWSEWVTTPLDVEAIKAGYIFDLSRDRKGNPIYWHNGSWVRWIKAKRGHRLQTIDLDDEEDEVKYCGRGDHVCRFLELFLRHTKDPLAGQPLRLLAWHRYCTQSIYGWVHRDSKFRRFTTAVMETGKKNAKSAVCSGYALEGLVADGEAKAMVYGAASDRSQARIVFNEARDYTKGSEELSEQVQIIDSMARLLHLETGSVYTVLSSDAFRNEGIDASMVIFDELHAQPNRKLFSVLRRAGRARRQPLTVVVTTYGKTLNSIWGEVHLRCKRIIEGTSKDWRTFVMIASGEEIPVVVTAPAKQGAKHLIVQRIQQPINAGQVIKLERSSASGEVEGETVRSSSVIVAEHVRRGAEVIKVKPLESAVPEFSEGKANIDWLSDHAIKCANPAVGIVFQMDRIQQDREECIGSPEAEAEYKQLSLNIVSGGGKRWLSHAAWLACGERSFRIQDLEGKYCWGGFDASFSNDLTAFWLAFPNWPEGVEFGKVQDPLIKLAGLVWVPGEGIEEREEREEFQYRSLAEKKYYGDFGAVRICAGPTIDYAQVGREIVEFTKAFEVRAVAYDPNYVSFVVGPHLVPSGLQCVQHRQGAVSMGPPTRWYETLVKRRQIAHGNHPLLDRAIDGAVLHSPDKAGNRYPSKHSSVSRIDPLIASLMAAGWCIDPPKIENTSGAWGEAEGAGMWG